MAINLGTQHGTAFNIANMKPLADEEMVALWGQNLLDNIAYLWTREVKAWDMIACGKKPGNTPTGDTFSGTAYFRQPRGHNQITGTFTKESASSGDVDFFIQGTEISQGPFTWDSSNVAAGAEIMATVDLIWTSNSADKAWLTACSAWSSHSDWVF